MALTSNDETDLLLPLYRGLQETPRFRTFLDRLRRRSQADYVAISIRSDSDALGQGEVYHVGPDLRVNASAFTGPETGGIDVPVLQAIRPHRVYALSELVERDPSYGQIWRRIGEPYGIVDQRLIRAPLEPGVNSLLIMARAKPCTAADSALLSNLMPYVETVLRALHTSERDRIEASFSADGLVRSGTGWIVFDSQARVIAIEHATTQRLKDKAQIDAEPGLRLRGITADAEKKIADAALRFSTAEHGPPGNVVLSLQPRIDALLLPTVSKGPEIGRFTNAVMTAYCRFETAASEDRSAQFAGLFELPLREAELAIALADGQTIAEAAMIMGLTLETARNYSKRLYAKLAVRGQAELVRLVHRSSAVLA